MTALGEACLRRLLEQRELVVSPILDEKQIQGASIDLRMGTVAYVLRSGGLSHVNPRDYLQGESSHLPYQKEQGRRQKLARNEVPFHEPLMLHPGTMVLVPTIEWIKLPVDLMGIVTARSSWAREGLSIATATFINPGYVGIITLELSNLGQVPIAIYPGMRIAQIALQKVSSPSSRKPGQFHLSFEPTIGRIVSGDEPFIPRAPPSSGSSKK